ncbi:hypothetical protein OF83DRAFT_1089624 [Amylostereum chailletii]|nr:hypothetical protein OF83DRAFT_1089624 [Amylostereum chailletii]
MSPTLASALASSSGTLPTSPAWPPHSRDGLGRQVVVQKAIQDRQTPVSLVIMRQGYGWVSLRRPCKQAQTLFSGAPPASSVAFSPQNPTRFAIVPLMHDGWHPSRSQSPYIGYNTRGDLDDAPYRSLLDETPFRTLGPHSSTNLNASAWTHSSPPANSRRSHIDQRLPSSRNIDFDMLEQADHKQLIRSGNSTYAHLYEVNLDLQASVASLTRENGVLQSLLQQRGQSSSTAVSPLAALVTKSTSGPVCNRADFPDVWNWSKQEWRSSKLPKGITTGEAKGKKGSTRMAQGINVDHKYILEADGTEASGEVMESILLSAAFCFAVLQESGIAPLKWDEDTNVEVAQYVYGQLENKHPQLSYCQDHWKAERVCKRKYPGWVKLRRERIIAMRNGIDVNSTGGEGDDDAELGEGSSNDDGERWQKKDLSKFPFSPSAASQKIEDTLHKLCNTNS